MKNKLFKNDAKHIVDLLFDSGLLAPGMTRDEMNILEDTLGYMLKSRYDSYIRLHGLKEKINNQS